MMTLFLIVLGIILAIGIIYVFMDRFKDAYEWNNGYCPRCGNPWDYRKYPVNGTIECECKHCHYKTVIFEDTLKNHWR